MSLLELGLLSEMFTLQVPQSKEDAFPLSRWRLLPGHTHIEQPSQVPCSVFPNPSFSLSLSHGTQGHPSHCKACLLLRLSCLEAVLPACLLLHTMYHLSNYLFHLVSWLLCVSGLSPSCGNCNLSVFRSSPCLWGPSNHHVLVSDWQMKARDGGK